MVICCSWISQSVSQPANDALQTLVGAVLFCLFLLEDGKDAVLALSRPCEHFPHSVMEIACSCVLDDTSRNGSCPGSLFCHGMHAACIVQNSGRVGIPRQLYAYIRLRLLNGFPQLDFRRERSVEIT